MRVQGALRDGQGGWGILVTYRGQGVLLLRGVTGLLGCLSSWSIEPLGGGTDKMVVGVWEIQ